MLRTEMVACIQTNKAQRLFQYKVAFLYASKVDDLHVILLVQTGQIKNWKLNPIQSRSPSALVGNV